MPKRLGKFELPNKLTKVEEGATATYAKFIAEPFEAGYGHTVGNSLRRVLLSSIEGSAISSIRIEGPGRFLIATARGGKIRFRSSHLEEQFDRLNVIFTYAENQGRFVHTVDLTPERNVPVTFIN